MARPMADSKLAETAPPALLEMGFRPFFAGASVFAVVSMALWGLTYPGHLDAARLPVPGIFWHVHELLYGYVMAVIAGFLLTAVSNWTGQTTLRGYPLILLFLVWFGARVAWLPGIAHPGLAMALDMVFSLWLLFSVSRPVIRARQWRQLAVLSKVALLIVCNLLFYLQCLEIIDSGFMLAVYGGFYLVIGLILTLARRVVPFFIERALPLADKPVNSRPLDLASLALFLVLFLSEVFYPQRHLSIVAATGLFLVNARRLWGWYVPGVWRRSMLWSLYLSQWLVALGFLALAMFHLGWIPRSLALHTLAVGGISLVTASMMVRVSLGHTGRSVQSPPAAIPIVFVILLSTLVFRVVLPAIVPAMYPLWILLSVLGWMAAFLVLSATMLPVWFGPGR